MTWYAQHVYAEPLPGVLRALGAAFPRALHHVPKLDAFDGDGTTFPATGLLVVRELSGERPARRDDGTYDADDHASGWFGEDAVPWTHAVGTERGTILVPADEVEPRPPEAFLAFLRAVSRDTRSIVTFFGGATWGGELEHASAWVFDGAEGIDYLYQQDAGAPAHVWSTRAPATRRDLDSGDVLGAALSHHGIVLRDGYFALHTRAFPWADYRLPAAT